MFQVSLTPQWLTINSRRTIMITQRNGEINEETTGLYGHDTRYLSFYRFALGGKTLQLLSASNVEHYASLSYFQNPQIGALRNAIPEGSLLLTLSRFASDGVHEDFELTSWADRVIDTSLAIELQADFTDILEARLGLPHRPKMVLSDWDEAQQRLRLCYRAGRFERALFYHVQRSTAPAWYAASKLVFPIELKPRGTFSMCVDLYFEEDRIPTVRCGGFYAGAGNEWGAEYAEWMASVPSLKTSNPVVNRAYEQAVKDLGALRLEADGHRWVPAAGIPWFAAVFGRDSLIVALQAMLPHHHVAEGVLERLARLQGTVVNPWTEEEPGKIPHELRLGELTVTGQLPYAPYYGTVDASLLYVITLYQALCYSGEHPFLLRHVPAAERCLEWAERYGDKDGDGFIEYAPASPRGYRNQGWKDAGDAILYPDGRLVDPPIALCEIQGYYYDALMKMAAIYDLVGEPSKSEACRGRAARLYERIQDRLWWPDEGCYVLGLDANKAPIRSVASNMGHLLWSGAVPPERARGVVSRLMAGDLFSGWGVRTLSAAHPRYNPLSYQRGSVWPHDNAIIAAGFAAYGYHDHAHRVAEGLFGASSCFDLGRLPELFAGLPRTDYGFPVIYREANVPQAWAAASIFLLLDALLGFAPALQGDAVWLDPHLPDWLPEVTLRGIDVRGERLSVCAVRSGDRTTWELLDPPRSLRVIAGRPASRAA